MIRNGIEEVTVEEDRILCLEPIRNHEKALFIDLWLKSELPTDRLNELLSKKQQYVQYFPDDFVEMINHEQD